MGINAWNIKIKMQTKWFLMIVPQKFRMISDNNELEFLETIKPKKTGEVHYVFKYSKSETKLGLLLGLTEPEIEKLISNNLITIL